MPLIYVSGPITHGHTGQNVRNGVLAADEIAQMGAATICPHLSHFYETLLGHGFGHEFWMNIDVNLIDRCDAVFRMEGYSPGGDAEVLHAQENGIPVIFNMDDMDSWITAWHYETAGETDGKSAKTTTR